MVSGIAGIQTQVFLIPGSAYFLQTSLSTEVISSHNFLPNIRHMKSYDEVYCLNKVPDFRLNILAVEFTITSALSLVISPRATWKVIAPIFIWYVVHLGLVTVLKRPEKKEDG